MDRPLYKLLHFSDFVFIVSKYEALHCVNKHVTEFESHVYQYGEHVGIRSE